MACGKNQTARAKGQQRRRSRERAENARNSERQAFEAAFMAADKRAGAYARMTVLRDQLYPKVRG